MEKININNLINRYKEWVEAGGIQFLPKGSDEQKEVISNLTALHTLVQKVTIKGGLSEGLDWRDTHICGEELWKNLASSALRNIEHESKGNSELFSYLDASTRFEDILYGIEEYYRDHTLHSLWVYFIGEYILREHLSDIHKYQLRSL